MNVLSKTATVTRSLALMERNSNFLAVRRTWSSHLLPLWLKSLATTRSATTVHVPSTRSEALGSTSAPATQTAPSCPPGTIQLRPYQEECIQACLTAFENGHKRLAISLATGSGKTVVFTQLIDRVKPLERPGFPVPANQTLIIAHRRELVNQAVAQCRRSYAEKTIEIEMGSLRATGNADITVASVRSLAQDDRLEGYDPRKFKLVLVDEAHHIVASTYMKVLGHFGLAKKQPDSPHLVGVSATFIRLDGLSLGSAIDEIVYHKDYIDMMKSSWLCDAVFTTVKWKADLSRVQLGANGGDFESGSLARAINTPELNTAVVLSWIKLASGAGRKSTLVFCVDRSHMRDLCQRFRELGVDARLVTGLTPYAERSSLLQGFKDEEFPVLLNCGVFTEGTDVPNIDCVLLVRPTRSRSLLVQMMGRGMRLHPGKKNCHVIDMVSSLDTGITTTPTLFGLDPDHLVTEASVEDMESMRKKMEARRAEEREERRQTEGSQAGQMTTGRSGATLRTGSLTFTDYDSIFDLMADDVSDRHVRSISQNAWVQADAHRYILYGVQANYIHIERKDVSKHGSIFMAYIHRRLPRGLDHASPYAKPSQLLVADSLEDAIHGCDTFAEKNPKTFPRAFSRSKAHWRSQPASEGQLVTLNKLRKDDPLKPEDIKKGRAQDWIIKLKHGALGYFRKAKIEKRREETLRVQEEKKRVMLEGNTISVGPVLQPKLSRTSTP